VHGGIEGSSELVSYAFRMVSGSLSDKIGKRKIFVLAGYTLSTMLYLDICGITSI
jgi:nitrate/nitrite transporter NarK